MDSDDGRYVTCCHEAGHVKACELRGVRVGRVHVDTEYGRVDFEDGSGVAYAFIAYAGPWAEARLRWTEVAIDDNTLDEEGRRFADHVAEAFSWNESDWVKYETEIGGDFSGLDSQRHHLPDTASTMDAVALVGELANDDTVDGILVQHPMPPQVDERQVFEAITPSKDVDGVTGTSFAAMALGDKGFKSCTPGGARRRGLTGRPRARIVPSSAIAAGAHGAMLTGSTPASGDVFCDTRHRF